MWDYLFGPLSAKHSWCKYFQFVAFLSLVMAIVSLMLLLMTVFGSSKDKNGHVAIGLGGFIQFLLMYFVSRLFYTMCVK
jgi:hypothetical protein